MDTVRMRAVVLGVAWLAVPVAVGHQASPRVSYENKGASAGTILMDLSPKVGRELLAAPMTQNEVLAIRLEDATVKETLERIAWAVGGSWKKEGQALRLIRSSENVADERMRERRWLVEAYARGLAKRREQLAQSGPFNPAKAEKMAVEAARAIAKFDPNNRRNSSMWEVGSKLSGDMPAGRAMSRILNEVAPAELADLPRGIRVVYSSHPNRMQRPLTAKIAAILADLRREQTVWADALEKHRVKSPQFGNTTYIFPGIYEADQPINDVDKVLLTAVRSRYGSFGGHVNFELILADRKGKVISRTNGNLGPDMALSPPAAPPKDDFQIEASPEDAAVYEAFMSYPRKAIPPAVRERLMRPEVIEPLSIMLGARMVHLARAKKCNGVFLLPDTGVFGMFGQQKKIGVTALTSVLKSSNEVVEEGEWIAVRPWTAGISRPYRIDRRVLGEYVRRVVDGRRMPIEEQAQWAIRLPLEEDNPLARSLVGMIQPEQQMRYYDAKTLRLFGSLTAAQRAAAKNGGLPLGALSPPQRELLDPMVFGENVHLQPDYQKAQELKIDYNLFWNGILREPTEVLPNGIPSDGKLTLTETVSEVAFTSDSMSGQYMRPSQGFSAEELGNQRFYQSRTDLFPWMNEEWQRQDFSRLRLGRRTNYQIQVQLTPVVGLHVGLEDREYFTGEPVPYDRLPAEFRKKADASFAEMQKNHANSRPGEYSGGGNNPPPPSR